MSLLATKGTITSIPLLSHSRLTNVVKHHTKGAGLGPPYRGTSLIRNTPPCRTLQYPYA